ncbi:MAG: hypothetical protein ABR867_04560, partial [Nitrososphaerales archaeon]
MILSQNYRRAIGRITAISIVLIIIIAAAVGAYYLVATPGSSTTTSTTSSTTSTTSSTTSTTSYKSTIILGTTDAVQTTIDPADAYDYFGDNMIQQLGA